MLTTSNTYKTLFANGSAMEVRATIDGVVYGANQLMSASYSAGLIDKAATVGNCIAREFNLAIWNPGTIARMATIEMEYRMNDGTTQSEWIPKGTYFIDTREYGESQNILYITGYDAMLKAEAMYNNAGAQDTWPKVDTTVISDICTRMGVTLDSDTSSILDKSYMVQYPGFGEGAYTLREVLGFIGAAYAGNWIITDEGELRLVQLGAVSAVSAYLATPDWEPITIGGNRIVVGDGLDCVCKTLKTASAFAGFTGVTIILGTSSSGELLTASAGTDTGRVLELDCPWGTQTMAANILTQISGYAYQPFIAGGAFLDPAVELGDGVTINGITSRVFTQNMTFSAAMVSDISAPFDDEVDHEYPYESAEDRTVKRLEANTKTSFTVMEGQISSLIETVALLGGAVEISFPTQAFTKAAGASSYTPASITLTAQATVTVSSYQWYKDGAAISGATSSTLTITPSDISGNSATYKVTVTDTDSNSYSDQTTIVKLADGEEGTQIWTATANATTPNYTFAISALTGGTGTPAVGDIVLRSYYRYTISSVNEGAGTVLTGNRTSLRGSAGAAGADGYTVTLSNEYIEIPTGADRKPTSATTYSCTVSVYKGTTALTPTTSTPADGQFRVQTGTAPTGITVAQSTAGTITLTTSTATAIADVSSLTLTITPYGASAITAVISISANMNAVTVTTKTLAEQTADQFTWIVASGTSASNFTLTSRMATLISDEIDLTGYVTFSNLQTSGQTIINADNLTTGTINAANVNLKGALSCLDSAGDATGNLNLVTADLYTSYVTGSNYMFGMSIDSRASGYNFGVGVQYSDANNTRPEMAMLWTPLSGVSCTWDESNHTGTLDIFAENNVFIWTDILYFDGTAKWWSSDRRVKSEVDYNVDRFLGAFDALRPCSFLYNSSRDGRRNIGMIAQDVEKALQDNGIDVGKINLVGTSSKTGQYFLDYDQFIPILIAKVQSQQKQIDALEAKLS